MKIQTCKLGYDRKIVLNQTRYKNVIL